MQIGLDKFSLGEILRNKREAMRMEIIEVSANLRIKQSDIVAIESDEIAKITSHIYVPGLIRSYAKFLHIEPNIVEEQIARLKIRSNVDVKKHMLMNIGEDDHLSPNKNFLLNAAIATLLMILLLFPLYNHSQNKSDLIKNSDLISQLNEVSLDEK